MEPNSNHVAVQTCGVNTNTPVHIPGTFTIGNDTNVQSCLLSQAAINTHIPMLAGTCGHSTCTDGPVHFVVIRVAPQGTAPSGTLMVWLDPFSSLSGTHTPEPTCYPVINVPYTINSGTDGLSLDPANGGSAWVGFSGSQSTQNTAQDILQWEFTPHTPTILQQPIPLGGVPNPFIFGRT